MTPSLRNRHRLMWIALSILLPLLFVATVMVIPQTEYEPDLPQAIEEAYPTLLRSTDQEAFLLNLRENQTGQKQLEIVLKKVLLVSAAQVYLKEPSGSETVLGALGTTGVYRFSLNQGEEVSGKYTIEIRDVAKGTVLLSTKL